MAQSSSDEPLVTTLIPTYRRPALLARAIRSALAQTMPRIRVSVFDNASGDETGDVVREFAAKDPRVQYHVQPENIGLIPNFNFALHTVETPYFSFLCDDDLLLPGFYQTALAGYEKHPDAMSSSGTILFTDMDGSYILRGPSIAEDAYLRPPDSLYAWRLDMRPLITANLMRRELIDSIGDLEAGFLGDLCHEMQIAARFPIVVCSRLCAIVVEHPQSSTKGDELDMELWSGGYAKIGLRLQETPNADPAMIDRALSTLRSDIALALFRMSALAVTRGNYSFARKIAVVLRERWGAPDMAKKIELSACVTERTPVIQPALAAFRKMRAIRRASRADACGPALQQYMNNPTPDFTL